MNGPLKEGQAVVQADAELVRHALGGSPQAIEELIQAHQPWIYNIAFRMVMHPADAEDVTQEILLKILTRLDTYQPHKAAFRTWLYRVTVNHVLNMKSRGWEKAIQGFSEYGRALEDIPDENPGRGSEQRALIEDSKVGCMAGMLLCLERKPRLVYILAEIFGVPDRLGAELMEISRTNFRKILSRGRARLYDFMHGNCGLVEPNNPCRCAAKTRGFVKAGWINPQRPVFQRETLMKVREVARQTSETFEKTYYRQYQDLFREHPFYPAPDFSEWLRECLEDEEFKRIFHLG